MLTHAYAIPSLPPAVELETVAVMRALNTATRALAELKGSALNIPNQGILIDTLALQEAKASSEIENIVTTQDEVFQADLFPDGPQGASAKEVARYRDALKLGHHGLRETGGIITNNSIIAMFQVLVGHDGGFRTTPGTKLKNERSGNVVYVPPPDGREIVALMGALERFINDDEACLLDPLIKMALIHHQFESIHPFPDGNGRIGRILNVLYLTRTGLLDIPILYLSRHITETKGDYYSLLQDVRDRGGASEAWQGWVMYMLEAVAATASTTLHLVEGIRSLMATMKRRLRDEHPKLYSQDLLNTLFRHPYTRIDFVVKDLAVTRQTAAKYLDKIAENGILRKRQAGKYNYYINVDLVRLFQDASGGR